MMQEKQIVKDLSKLQTQLNKLLVKSSTKATPSLIKKVKRIYYKLFNYFSTGKVKKLALGSAAALLLQGNVHAQNFSSLNTPDPYSVTQPILQNVNRPEFVDMDNDGDQDIIYFDRGSVLRYIPNTTSGSNVSFGTLQTNPFNFSYTPLPNQSSYSYSPFVDLDNDGDFDFMFYAFNGYTGTGGSFMYYENKGTPTAPNFNVLATNPFSLTTPANSVVHNIDFVDLDGDGDFDILAETYDSYAYAFPILYYQNTGTANAPSFAAPVTSPFNLPLDKGNFQFIDIDRDGDQDFFYADVTNNKVVYHPNTGSATSASFGAAQNDPFNLSLNTNNRQFSFGDMDNDGKRDFVQVTLNKVYLRRNITVYSSTDKIQNKNLDINIYPTPSHDLVNVKLGKQDDYTLEVFNLQGQQLKTESVQQATQHQLDLSELASGQYLLRISNAEAYTTKQLIKQ
ncbi:MAG: T9SS type A sorting domain-containing protein [Aureispira sp.]|nr:T9SS type A sorting domain-containing protein [Aureispira sp.]